MATPCTLAPFINQDFYITGYWGEPRSGHIHAGLDLSTGGINPVYNMKEGDVIFIDPNGTTGSGYRTLCYNTKLRRNYLAIW